MEGAQDLRRQLSYNDAKAERIGIVIVVLFHIVGLAGFIIPSLNHLFLRLVPWHLLLMAAVVFYTRNSVDTPFLLFALLIFITGFCAELIGVHTGLLFGNYNYGDTLGTKLFGIPLMIGVNWLLLIYATGGLMQYSRVKNTYIRILAGALILVLLDVLIEPVAIRFNYWHWIENTIPLKNYVCWFLLSALMLYAFEKFKLNPQNRVAPVLLLMQFVFFIVLELLS